jgi:competence ComEA-like helix-hairpin-helix protein
VFFTTPLAWTMRKRRDDREQGAEVEEFSSVLPLPTSFSSTGVFTLLFLLLLTSFLNNAVKWSPAKESRLAGNVFVQASGQVKTPGVYGFEHAPSLKELIDRAGGLMPPGSPSIPKGNIPLSTGSRVVVTRALKQVAFVSERMSAFYRLTLGIPISVNADTALGLTAVPGIGPKRAAAIVSARERTGGFKQLNDLLAVRGISPSLYRRIRPYLTL